jgi:hypothetical protein
MFCTQTLTGGLFPIILSGINYTALCQPKTPNQFPKTHLKHSITPYISNKSRSPPSRFQSESAHRHRDAPFSEPSFIRLSNSLVNEPTLGSPNRDPMERDACLQSLLLHITWQIQNLTYPSTCLPVERDAPSPEPTVYSCINIFQNAQLRSPSMKRGKIYGHCPQTNVDTRPTHNGVQPVSPRGLLTTLLSLPQFHRAFSMIPSILARVDQSPFSQCVVVTFNKVYPPHLLP